MDLELNRQSVWSRLHEESRPIVLYGMGNGADKILNEFEKRGIKAAGVFASDEFVRGHSYRGFAVKKFSEITQEFGENIIIVVSFASSRPDVMARIYALASRYDVVAPDVPVVAGEIFDEAFAIRHRQAIQDAYELLADAQSKAVFRDTIAFKLSGDVTFLRRSESTKDEVFQSILCPSADEHFVDLGAYTGDTIRELLGYTAGQYGSITALEPDRKTFKKLMLYAEQALDLSRVQLLQAGAWSEDATMQFEAAAGRQSKVSHSGMRTQMRSVDSVLGGARCSLLKLDVEGSEREAIAGAMQTIQSQKPKLNLAAYHKSEDFFELPLLLHEMCPSYRFYLRHHPYIPAWDTNLYAIAHETTGFFPKSVV